MSNLTPKHFRCSCGAIDETTIAIHPSQTYCGLCKTIPVHIADVVKPAISGAGLHLPFDNTTTKKSGKKST